MRRTFIIALVMIGLSCSGRKSGIIIAGSTSVQPFIEKISEHFGAIYPGMKVTVQGGGSSAGIQATMTKTCDIGMSSRNLRPEEKKLREFLIALDGIAVIVNRDNPVRGLSIEQIRMIFTGEIVNWKDLGGPDRRIYPVTREEGSGTRGTFEDMVMHERAVSDACLVQDSNGAVREIIANSPYSIGYISAGLIDERIHAVAVDSILPTYESISAGRYKIVRPFLLLTGDVPAGPVRDFINYVLSLDGQEILRKVGLIPVLDMKE